MSKYMVVPTLSALHALQNHEENECILCEENHTIYTWKNDDWEPIKINSEGISMSLYDLNKSIINQLKPMETSDFFEKTKLFKELKETTNNRYYMLLCKDFNYYTIFAENSNIAMPHFVSVISEIVMELGKVISIEFTEDKNAIEFWIIPEGEENAYVFYLFPYDSGVVQYG